MGVLETTYFGNTVLQLLYFFGTIAIGIIAGKILGWIIANVVKRFTEKTKTDLDDVLVQTIERPLVFLLIVLGLNFGRLFLTLSTGMDVILSNVVTMLFMVDIAWFILNGADSLLVHYITPMASKTNTDLDDHLLPLLRKVMRFIIISITLIMIIDNFGYNVSSLIAGLGIGGLAFALAAKDILGNLFGGIAIATDRPFKVGDRVIIDDVDGFVRDIGLRTTRIETLDDRILTLPNSMIIETAVVNVTSEPTRKVKMTIGVEYGTSIKKMKEAKKILEDTIKKHKKVNDEYLVSFTEFADSSLNFLVIYRITDLVHIFEVMDEVNMNIKEKFEKAGIEMAFPTRTLHMVK